MIIGHPMVGDLNLRRSAEIWKSRSPRRPYGPVAGHGGYDMDFRAFSVSVLFAGDYLAYVMEFVGVRRWV